MEDTTKATKSITKKETKKKVNPIDILSKIYDVDYYENGKATEKSNYENYSWQGLSKYFQRTASHIVDVFKPKTVLDIGCAKGFLVKALSDLGVNAYGVDPSKYAIENSLLDIKENLKLGIVQELPYDDEMFDIVTCFDVMEHIPENDVSKVLEEMLRVAKQWVVIRVVTKELPNDVDNTHETIKDKKWWNKQIKAVGGKVEPIENYINNQVWWFNVPEFLIVVKK